MYPRDLPVLASATPVSIATPTLPQDLTSPGLSLPQWVSILWAYRKQTLMIASAVILTAALALALWPRTYTATSTLMVNYEVNDPLAGHEFTVGMLGSYIATQLALMQSPEVLLPVMDKYKLTQKKD